MPISKKLRKSPAGSKAKQEAAESRLLNKEAAEVESEEEAGKEEFGRENP